jgi:hypothetical protein
VHRYHGSATIRVGFVNSIVPANGPILMVPAESANP